MKPKFKKATFLSAIAVIVLCASAFWLGSVIKAKSIVKATETADSVTDNSSNPDLSSATSDTENSSDTSGNTEITQGIPEADLTGNTDRTTALTTSDITADTTALSDKEESILYTNTKYGFDFKLPKSWDGYTIQNEVWQGTALNESKQDTEVVATGDLIIIRHPEWTSENPRQDIPIMVFTSEQWEAIANEDIAVSAAPVPPTKIGNNSKYVFAIPARYNYAFPTGYEEVEDILAHNPLTVN